MVARKKKSTNNSQRPVWRSLRLQGKTSAVSAVRGAARGVARGNQGGASRRRAPISSSTRLRQGSWQNGQFQAINQATQVDAVSRSDRSRSISPVSLPANALHISPSPPPLNPPLIFGREEGKPFEPELSFLREIVSKYGNQLPSRSSSAFSSFQRDLTQLKSLFQGVARCLPSVVDEFPTAMALCDADDVQKLEQVIDRLLLLDEQGSYKVLRHMWKVFVDLLPAVSFLQKVGCETGRKR
jgi:hypothetical protein